MFALLDKLFRRNKKIPDPMKYLITGIGNMGADYEGTRHNIGFDVIDLLAKSTGGAWKHEYLGDLCEIKHKGRTLILLKPSTYVNLSGKAVRHWLQKKHVQVQNLLVVVDDMNLPFGKLRLRGKGTDGGHKGLKDINATIGSDYARLRIGIGNSPRGRHIDFVLGTWDKTEVTQIPSILEKAAKIVTDFTAIGLERAMQSASPDPD
ncbi:MAG TPA: aminoacyl-tRNA hydrolase [Saprospiraceae bacterium]|nr:aminoacyl-tRNA hydrolase [Saprospiraceae bacterium]